MTTIKTKMELITPQKAIELMKLNTSNRSLNKKTLKWYSQQMTDGQWTISGQTISISDKEVLLDGQHRLAAIIESGVPIYFNISRNVPHESFINYDNLRSRGLADVFSIENIPNYSVISSIIKKYNTLHIGLFSSNTVDKGTSGRMSNIESLQFYNSHKELMQHIATESQSCYTKLRLLTTTQVGSLMLYLILDKKHDNDLVFSFFRQLFFNESVENVSIINLREKLVNTMLSNYQMTYKIKHIFITKCWNAFMIGKELKIYTWNESSHSIPSFI